MGSPKVNRRKDTGFVLCAVGILLGFVLISRPHYVPTPLKSHTTVFDTAIEILRDFVRAGDFRLGFPDTNGLGSAYIDTNEGIHLAMLLEKDLVGHGLDTSTILDLHRITYPVYAKGILHSAITFDSTLHGWVPVRFADAVLIQNYLEFHRYDSRDDQARQIVEIPSLHGEVFIGTAMGGEKTVVIPQILNSSLKKHLPLIHLNSTALPQSVFEKSITRYLIEDDSLH